MEIKNLASAVVDINDDDETGEFLALPTPGSILLSEFMQPLGVTPYRLAKDIGVDQGRIEAILDGKRAITTDTALRLARYLGMSAEFWLNLQVACDLRRVEREADAEVYDRIVMHPAAARALGAAI